MVLKEWLFYAVLINIWVRLTIDVIGINEGFAFTVSAKIVVAIDLWWVGRFLFRIHW
jgi:hypothetical protein